MQRRRVEEHNSPHYPRRSSVCYQARAPVLFYLVNPYRGSHNYRREGAALVIPELCRYIGYMYIGYVCIGCRGDDWSDYILRNQFLQTEREGYMQLGATGDWGAEVTSVVRRCGWWLGSKFFCEKMRVMSWLNNSLGQLDSSVGSLKFWLKRWVKIRLNYICKTQWLSHTDFFRSNWLMCWVL